MNFQRLLEFNNGKVPFASAQIGRSFRNEISPRAGLLRVREFTMAEIEHFVDPEDKRHDRFNEVRDVELALLDRDTQSAGSTVPRRMTIGAAVDAGVIANETLGYFVARIYLFLTKIGIDPQRLRFRQHMANEMAHYATDCWDGEIQNATGWTECVGCADRAAYDLTVHAKRTGAPLIVREALADMIVTEKEVAEFNKKIAGKTFGKDWNIVQGVVNSMSEEALIRLKGELAQGCVCSLGPVGPLCLMLTTWWGCIARLPSSLRTAGNSSSPLRCSPSTDRHSNRPVSLRRLLLRASSDPFLPVREFTPNVIEPSFGLGRILYILLEHSFWSREQDVERGVSAFSVRPWTHSHTPLI